MKSIASAIRMCGSIVIASGIKEIFSKLCAVMGSPSSKIEPPLIGVNFIIAFKIVVFPTPFTPIRHVISPLPAVNETPFNTSFQPSFFVISLTSIIPLPLFLVFFLDEADYLLKRHIKRSDRFDKRIDSRQQQLFTDG